MWKSQVIVEKKLNGPTEAGGWPVRVRHPRLLVFSASKQEHMSCIQTLPNDLKQTKES